MERKNNKMPLNKGSKVKIRKIQSAPVVGSISRKDARRAARIVSDESKAKAKKKGEK